MTPKIQLGPGHTMRTATADDLPLIRAAILADPDHDGRVPAEFFLNGGEGVDCCVVEDRDGTVYYIRFEHCLRLHIQFTAAQSPDERERNRDGLIAGLGWLRGYATARNIRQLIFESAVQPLVRFCERALGWRQSPYEIVLDIPPIPAPNTPNSEKDIAEKAGK